MALAPHDETILYLKRRFDVAADALARSGGRRQVVLFRVMSAHAAAMATIPASISSCIDAKREVAAWSFAENEQALSLPDALVTSLDASALRDEARQPAR